MSNFSEFTFDSPFDSPFDADDSIVFDNDTSSSVNIKSGNNTNQEINSLQGKEDDKSTDLINKNIENDRNLINEGIKNETTQNFGSNIAEEKNTILQPNSQSIQQSNNQQLIQPHNTQSVTSPNVQSGIQNTINNQSGHVSNVQSNQQTIASQPEQVLNVQGNQQSISNQPEQVSNIQSNQHSISNQPEQTSNKSEFVSNINLTPSPNVHPEKTSNIQTEQISVNQSNTQPQVSIQTSNVQTPSFQIPTIQPFTIPSNLSIEEQLALLKQQQELLLKQQQELLKKQQQQQPNIVQPQDSSSQQLQQTNQLQSQETSPSVQEVPKVDQVQSSQTSPLVTTPSIQEVPKVDQVQSSQTSTNISHEPNQIQSQVTTQNTQVTQPSESNQVQSQVTTQNAQISQSSVSQVTTQDVQVTQSSESNQLQSQVTTQNTQVTQPSESNQVQSQVTTQNTQVTQPKNPSQTTTMTIDPSTMWKEAKAPNGRTYYYNKITKQTTWKRPPEYQGGSTSPRSGTVTTTMTSSQSFTTKQVNEVIYKKEVGLIDQSDSQTTSGQESTTQTNTQFPNPNNLDVKNSSSTSEQLLQSQSSISESSEKAQTTSQQPQQPEQQEQKPLPKLFRVRLPDDQRQVVRFRPNDKLRDILRKICASRPFTEEDYIPKDSTGKVIDIDLTLGEIGLEEITFTTPKDGFKAKDESDQKKSKRILSDLYHVNASLSSSLHTAIKLYKEPLLELSKGTDCKIPISETQCGQLFEPLQQIADECYSFKQLLASHIETWPLNIEEPFRKHLDLIPHFLNYVNNFNNTMLIIEKLRDNITFCEVVDKIQRKNGQKLKLEDFFILPATKISVIVDLINELCQLLGDVHDNYMLLKELYDRLFPHKELSMKIKSEYEARSKILFIEKNVQKYPKKIQLLNEPRKFYREGIIDIEVKKNAKTMPFYVFIFTDLMVICKFEKKSKKPISYSYFDIVHFVKGSTHVEETASSSYTFTINIDSPKKGKLVYTCTVTNQTEGTKADWMASIRSAIEELNTREQ